VRIFIIADIICSFVHLIFLALRREISARSTVGGSFFRKCISSGETGLHLQIILETPALYLCPRAQIYGRAKKRRGAPFVRKRKYEIIRLIFSGLYTPPSKYLLRYNTRKCRGCIKCILFHAHNGVFVYVSYLVLMLIARIPRKFRHRKCWSAFNTRAVM